MQRWILIILALFAIVACRSRRSREGADASNSVLEDASAASSVAAITDGGRPSARGQTYVSPSGGFEVRFPDGKSPDVESTTITSTLAVRSFAVRYGTSAFLVSYDDHGKTSGRAAERILAAAKEGIVEATGGSIDAETPLLLAGYPGKELIVSATTAGIVMRQRVRLYVVAGRLYQVVMVSPSWAGTSPLEAPFFDSFALLSP